jgi:hypothetical protein
MLSFAGSVFRALTLGLFVLFFLAALPQAAVHVAERAGEAIRRWNEPPEAARQRILGEPYAAAIERIRRAVPRNGDYLLVDGAPAWEGGSYWVRFELAPRRARFLGPRSELASRRRLPPEGSLVVIAFGDGVPPLMMDCESFLRELDKVHDGG